MSSFDPSKSGNCAQSTPQREDGENRSGSTWNSLPRTSLSKPFKSSSSSSTTLDESLLEGASESLDLDSIKYDSYKTPVNYEEHQAAGKLASHLAPRGRKLTTKTIHFSMRNAQQDWSNVNPILTLVDTLEWACSRLKNCMKRNDLTAHMQRLQSPNLCQAHHITFRKLASLCSVEDQHCADLAEDPYVNGKNNQPTSAENTRKKLVFQVSTSGASSNARRPCLRLLRQTHCASTQGPLLSGRQMEQILGDGTMTLSDGTNRLIPLGTPVIMALETLSKRFSTLPREMGPNNAEEIFLNELVKLIRCSQQEMERKKQHYSSPDANSPCWLSCTCDGTLTIRYPSGHPAIIWTPTPLTYAPVVSGFPGEQNLDPVPRSPATTGQKTVTMEKRRNSGSTVHTSSRSSTSTGKRIERNRPVWQQAIALPSKTGFYLFLFDIPASVDSTTNDPRHFTPADGESISRLPRNAATLPNDKVQRLLLQMPKPTSKRLGQLVSGNRQFAMQSGPTGPASFSNATRKPGCLEVHGHNQSLRLMDMTKGSAPTPQIGQLLAYVTPTGHGAVFRNLRLNQQSGCQPDIRLLPHSNLQAVFSSNFIQFHHEPNERHLPSVALSGRDFKSDPTMRFPSSLDLHLNEYLKIYHSGPGHLMIVFRLGDQVELSIVCDQYISEPETVGDHQSPSERTVTTEASAKSRLLSKLPFLNTLVKSSSSHLVLRNHKKREVRRATPVPPNTDAGVYGMDFLLDSEFARPLEAPTPSFDLCSNSDNFSSSVTIPSKNLFL
ncbi:unnamed protein product [Dicrocoelium dendriticum]|nr:unnamed protein product [Dicrocoelium dendriticum]